MNGWSFGHYEIYCYCWFLKGIFIINDAIVGAYFTYKTVMKKIDNKIVGRIVLIVLFILVLLLLGVYIFLGFGKRKLMNNSTTTIPDMEG